MLLDSQTRFSTSPFTTPIPTIDASTPDAPNTNDIFDDIFSSSPPHSSHLPQPASTEDSTYTLATSNLQERSDIPRLQSQHSTAGYREGIASSKGTFVQEGFDEGYMLGAELGMRCGLIVGVLYGCTRACVELEMELERCNGLLREARKELSVKGLYAPEYFGQDGIWKYDVSEKAEGQEEEELDFRKVASAHPLVVKWVNVVEALARDLGLDLGSLKDRDAEAGD
jgi:hypothetical protein